MELDSVITITLKMLSGKTISIKIGQLARVWEFKAAIYDHEGIHSDAQRLISKGK